MNNVIVLDESKRKKDNIIIILFIFLLFVLFVIGLSKTYEKGFIGGASSICSNDNLDLGINQNSVFVCYNKSMYEDNNNNFVLSEDLGWDK